MKSPVTTTLLSYASAMMQEQLVCLKELPTKPHESERIKLLIKLGFDQTKEVKVFNAKMAKYSNAARKNIEAKMKIESYNNYLREAFKILITARRDFSPDVLLLNFENFQRLLKKYNLVCGLFQDYKGSIPTEKLEEIAGFKKLVPPLECPDPYINTLYKFDEVIVDEHNSTIVPHSALRRFPFIIAKSEPYYSYIKGVDCLGYSCGQRTERGYRITNYTRMLQKTYWFICAPAKQMNTPFLVRKINFYKDPFVCVHTDYGILILTRWGEEASSKIVKKYEELNKRIDERAKELNIEL